MSPIGRALRAAVPFALVPAVVLGLIVGVVAGAIPGVIVFVVVAAVLAAWARFAGDRLVASRLRGRDAEPSTDARLCNLVEGLSITAGVRQPRIVVVANPGLNAMVAGTGPERAVLAVTTGLLEGLERVELEAVLAEELVQIRQDEILPATVLVSTFGLGRSRVVRSDRDVWADRGAVKLTRYPPALASALEKVEAGGSTVEGIPGYMAHLWLADPGQGGGLRAGRLPVRDRIEALREL